MGKEQTKKMATPAHSSSAQAWPENGDRLRSRGQTFGFVFSLRFLKVGVSPCGQVVVFNGDM